MNRRESLPRFSRTPCRHRFRSDGSSNLRRQSTLQADIDGYGVRIHVLRVPSIEAVPFRRELSEGGLRIGQSLAQVALSLSLTAMHLANLQIRREVRGDHEKRLIG